MSWKKESYCILLHYYNYHSHVQYGIIAIANTYGNIVCVHIKYSSSFVHGFLKLNDFV